MPSGLAPCLMPFPVRDAAARERERRRREGETVIETPSKRRRLEANNVDTATALVAVKREQSPTSLQPSPSQTCLRTSGVVFVKYPGSCLPGEDNWKTNRDRCLLEETTKLQALGLKIVRRLVRDDGLAFDWASEIPIDPVTLKPPNPTPETAQVSANPIANSGLDLLGHALRDQVVTLRQSLTSTEPVAQPAPPNVARLMNVDRSVTLVEASSGEDSGFAVVGAAIKNITSHDERRTPSASPPKEYRRLIPQEFRIYRQVENKFKYRLHEPLDRRRRRMEWIQKEIEKIEGYTGEKVAGYRYERNDVIITLKNRTKTKNTFNQSKGPQPSRPTPLGPKTYKNPLSKLPKDGHADKPQPTINTVSLAEATCPPNPTPTQPSNSVQAHSQATRSDSPPDLQNRIQTKGLPLPHSSEDSSSSRPSSSSSTRREISIYHSRSSSNTPPVPTKRPRNQESPIVISSSSPQSHGGRSDMSVSPSPRRSFSPQASPTLIPRESTAQQDSSTMETRGLRFLERYLTLYDTDRKALTSAFTPNATFSLSHDAQKTKSRSSQVTTGPSAIVQAIENLDNDLHHSIRGNISYDMTPLDDVDLGAMLLTCDGTIVPRDHSTPTRTFSRVFVLRRNTDHDRDVWPLKISAEKLGLKQI